MAQTFGSATTAAWSRTGAWRMRCSVNNAHQSAVDRVARVSASAAKTARFVVAEVERLGEPLDEIGTPDQLVEPGAIRSGDADDRDPAVGGREHPVHAGDQRVTVVRSARRLTGEQRRGDLRRLRPDLPAEQRHVDPLPATGPLTREQGGADPTDEVEAGDVVADRDGDRAVRVAVGADRADQSAGGLGAEVGTLPPGVGALGAEARAGGVDDARVAGRDLLVRQTPLVERART